MEIMHKINYASSRGSNSSITTRGGYYGSDRRMYHDGYSGSSEYRGI